MELQNLQTPAIAESLSAEIQDWLVNYLSNLLDLDPDDIDTELPFERYDLDSSASIGMVGDLERWLERRLDSTILYEYPTIDALVEHLVTTA